MTPAEAIRLVRQGSLVLCNKEDYAEIRSALQQYAADCIDDGQDVYAIIALNEVKRLDEFHS